MNLTTEQLKELENLAGLFFKIPEIMIVLEIPIFEEDEFTDLITNKINSSEYIAYNKGRLTASVELRQSIKTAALNGSNPAQITMNEFYKQS